MTVTSLQVCLQLQDGQWEVAAAQDGHQVRDGREELNTEQEETTTTEISNKAKCSRCLSSQNKFEETFKKIKQVKTSLKSKI